MAEPHAHSQPIETYGPAPHNRNIWPHNSQAAVFCLRFWPILLFALVAVVYPLLSYQMVLTHTIETYGPQPHNRNIWSHTIARRRPFVTPGRFFCLLWLLYYTHYCQSKVAKQWDQIQRVRQGDSQTAMVDGVWS